MSLTAPSQQLSVDPFSENRFSSVINRLSRVITGGEDNDVILFPDDSFLIERKITDSTADYDKILASHGLCVKDDLLLHITEDDYVIDFSDTSFYADLVGGMTQEGWYYLVLYYNYARSYPPPKAYYMIIKDTATYYTGHESSYIFLAAIHIVPKTGGGYRIGDIGDDILYYDPDDPTDPLKNRRYPKSNLACIDGGVIA